MSDINSESEGFWVGDCDETLDNAANVNSYLHKHKMVCVYVWCFVSVGMVSHVQREKGGRQGNRNTGIIKSLRDRDG